MSSSVPIPCPEDYLDMIVPANKLMAEIHAYSVANGGDKITMKEIDAEIAACRAEQKAFGMLHG